MNAAPDDCLFDLKFSGRELAEQATAAYWLQSSTPYQASLHHVDALLNAAAKVTAAAALLRAWRDAPEATKQEAA